MHDEQQVALITVRARSDPEFPGTLFVTLNRHDLAGGAVPGAPVNAASAEEALVVLGRWLAELEAGAGS